MFNILYCLENAFFSYILCLYIWLGFCGFCPYTPLGVDPVATLPPNSGYVTHQRVRSSVSDKHAHCTMMLQCWNYTIQCEKGRWKCRTNWTDYWKGLWIANGSDGSLTDSERITITRTNTQSEQTSSWPPSLILSKGIFRAESISVGLPNMVNVS